MDLIKKLEQKQIEAQKLLAKHHPHAIRLLASTALTSSLLLSSPALLTSSQNITFSSSTLTSLLPKTVGPLIPEIEEKILEILKNIFGIKITAELDGNRLNQNYGFIGAEQHLPRYPGDTIDQHDEYQMSGMTPGRGAWGYFANSKQELTPDLIQKEKYYVAVQTLYLPDWNTRQPELKDWYKFRKVIVINPVNAKAVIAVIADAGPANWTGKHFGGSPEVMAYLGLNIGMQKGAVLLFFVDDQGNNVQLGPVS